MLIWPDENKGNLADLLLGEFGPFIPVSQIWRQLSYPSLDSARRSFARGLSPIAAVKLAGRRGHFVKTQDLVAWLRSASSTPPGMSRQDAT